MESFITRLRGPGWGLGPLLLTRPREVVTVPAGEPERLDELLGWLDALGASGDPHDLAAGFLTYEAGVFLEGSVRLFRPPERTPLAAFARYRLDERQPVSSAPPAPPRPLVPRGGSHDETSWASAVEAIRDGIARGDVYQVNLTRRTTFSGDASPLELADLLFSDSPVPFAVTLATPAYAVVSNSPELLLDVDLASRRVESRPIKGTIDRSVEDAIPRLDGSAKDAAEHVMIVDLIRNDLGRVSEPGSVTVPRLKGRLPLRHLHHLESTVVGTLRRDALLSAVLRAALPGGSITGAPKRASLRFIHDLEPVPRGPYTGAAGYVRGDGRAVLNVAIRTAITYGNGLDYHAGGGIVWDSEPGAEWRETETKSRELAAALRALGTSE